MAQWSSRPYNSRTGSYEDNEGPSRSSWQQSAGDRYGDRLSASTNAYGGSHRASQSQQLGPSSNDSFRTASPGSGTGHRLSQSTSVPSSQQSNGNAAPPIDKPSVIAATAARPAQQPAGSMHDMERIVQLMSARKFYCEGYIKKAVDLGGDGRPPNHGDPLAQWDDWFAQLTGSELSLWNVSAMNKAAAAGTTVPPTYLKINDSFVTFVDLNPRKAQGGGPPPDAPWVFALNNAGSNRILFACADEVQHRRWLNALRLAEWEVSRMSEIYTATLLGLRGSSFWNRNSLVKGVMEGAVDVRLPGETEWSKAYLVLTEATAQEKQKRRSSLLQSFSGFGSVSRRDLAKDAAGGSLNGASHAAFYASKRSKKPFLLIHNLLAIYAVYPESKALVYQSTIAKVEASVEWDDGAEMPKGFELNARRRDVRDGGRAGGQSALLFIPEDISRDGHARMLEWILGFCDTFKHWGRGRTAGVRSPYEIEFDPRKSASPYYAYPIGPSREQLFFAPATVEHLDIYERRPEQIRAAMQDMLVQRMRRAPSTGPTHPAGYLENGVPARQNTSQAPQLDTIGETGTSRQNSMGAARELDAAATAVPATVAEEDIRASGSQAPTSSPRPALSIDTGPALAPALPQSKRPDNPYIEGSKFSPSTLNTSQPASAIASNTAPLKVGAPDIDRQQRDPSPRRGEVVLQEVVQPAVVPPATVSAGNDGRRSVSPLLSAKGPPVLPATTMASAERDSNENGIGSYDSTTHKDMLAALDFVQKTSEPEIAAPVPRVSEHYRRPPSVASSAPTSRRAADDHPTALVEPTSPDEYSGIELPRPGQKTSASSSAKPSSLGRSRQAEEREAVQRAQAESLMKPGRAGAAPINGIRGRRNKIGDFSSDEDEVPEDDDSDAGPTVPQAAIQATSAPLLSASTSSSADRRNSMPRALPAIPSSASRFSDPNSLPPPARQTSPLSESVARRQSAQSSPFERSPDIQTAQLPPQQRAFQPGGLLQTGLQNRQDRSAKAMEASARETGAPLIDLPPRAPEAQTGLVGHIAATEKDRLREGGTGAAITRQERDRRESMQRASLASSQPQHPSMYGMPPYGMMYPGFGMPPPMPGMSPQMGSMPWQMDPQALFAAQMAAQSAFMNAMAAYSQQQQQPGMSAPASPTAPYPAQYPNPSAFAMPPGAGPYGGYPGSPGAFPPQPSAYSGASYQSGPPAGAGKAVRSNSSGQDFSGNIS